MQLSGESQPHFLNHVRSLVFLQLKLHGGIHHVRMVFPAISEQRTADDNLTQERSSQTVMEFRAKRRSAMQAILDGMIRGDLQRVNTAAKTMEDYGDRIEWYLSYPEYEKQAEGFRNSVEALQEAAGRGDGESAKEAVLELERSCIECHMAMNQQNGGPK